MFSLFRAHIYSLFPFPDACKFECIIIAHFVRFFIPQRRKERKVSSFLRDPKPALGVKIMAADLRVPISVLAGHVLRQWLAQNYETLLNDKHKKLEFADYLARKYLSNQPE